MDLDDNEQEFIKNEPEIRTPLELALKKSNKNIIELFEKY